MSKNKSKETKDSKLVDIDELEKLTRQNSIAEGISAEFHSRSLRKPVTIDFQDPPDLKNVEEEEECESEDESIKIKPDRRRDSDTESEVDEDDELDMATWPGYLDRIIYQFQDKFLIVQTLMNKFNRKVYSAFRKADNLPVVIVVCEDMHKKQKQKGIPREVLLLTKVKDNPNVCQILGWKKINDDIYCILMNYYVECDVALTTAGNAYLIGSYMKSLLTGLAYIHEKKVCHRDIAVDNVMWNPVTRTAVITDFDTSCCYRSGGYYRDVGRDNYDSPEKTALLVQRRKDKKKTIAAILKGRKYESFERKHKPYSEKSDVYSCGVIFWMLLNETDSSPEPERLKSWIGKIKKSKKQKKYPELDLLLKMLVYDPAKRISIEEALDHPFLRKLEPDEEYDAIVEFMKPLLENDAMKAEDYNALEGENSDSGYSSASGESEEVEEVDEKQDKKENKKHQNKKKKNKKKKNKKKDVVEPCDKDDESVSDQESDSEIDDLAADDAKEGDVQVDNVEGKEDKPEKNENKKTDQKDVKKMVSESRPPSPQKIRRPGKQ